MVLILKTNLEENSLFFCYKTPSVYSFVIDTGSLFLSFLKIYLIVKPPNPILPLMHLDIFYGFLSLSASPVLRAKSDLTFHRNRPASCNILRVNFTSQLNRHWFQRRREIEPMSFFDFNFNCKRLTGLMSWIKFSNKYVKYDFCVFNINAYYVII